MRYIVTWLCYVCLVGFVDFVSSKSLPMPSYAKACSRNDPDINSCALKSGRAAIPHFIDGDRKYKIPVLDPLEISHLQVDAGVLGLNFSADQVKVHGLRHTKLNQVIWDANKKVGIYKISIPRVEVNAQYVISGRILILPITGNGNANLTFNDVAANYTFGYEIVDREGVEFVLPTTSHLTFDTSRMFVKLENLFNGNKLLGDQTNAFMNESWRDVVKELGPILADTIGEIMRRIQYNIFELVDYDTALPKNMV